MGASLAKVALSPTWAHLPPKAQILFAYMAITAKDDDKPPRYFGGRDALVLALYGRLSDDPKELLGQRQYVRQLIKQVRDAGGLVLMNEGQIRAGHGRAEYEIRVFGKGKVRESQALPSERVPGSPSGGTPPSPSGRAHRPEVGEPTDPPKEYRGTTKGLTGGNMETDPSQTYVGDTPELEKSEVVCSRCGRPEKRHHLYAAKRGHAHDFEPRMKASA